jgi:hypothetical protein
VFVNPVKKPIPSVKASLANNGKSMRTGNASVTLREGLETSSNMITKLPPNTLVTVSSASDNSYRVELPDGSFGFLNSTSLQPALNPLRQTKLTGESAVLDKPSSTAARKTLLPAGTVVSVLGTFESFAYIKAEENWGWINFP